MVAIVKESLLLEQFGLKDINSFYELEYSIGPSLLRDELLRFDFESFYGSFREIYRIADIVIGSDYMGNAYIKIDSQREEEESLF